MKKLFASIRDFYRNHRLFSLFFVAMLVLNFTFIGFVAREATTFFTCSTYDRGPLGTYALYSYLYDKKVKVARLNMALYKELQRMDDTGMTLVIISPRIQPGSWEWKYLMEWVEKGNRLITAGVFMPFNYFSGAFQVRAWPRWVAPCSLRVALPVDGVFPCRGLLPPLLGAAELTDEPAEKNAAERRVVAALSHLKPGMLPLLTYDTLSVAAKQVVGRGEWIMFAHFNPFANRILRNERWFGFARRLFTGDGRFSGARILFDEYHNGYSATKSLWALLRYYRFDTSIIIGALCILAYLFFTGIRILPPRDRPAAPSHDVVPGLKSMAGLFLRYNYFGGLIHREIRLLRRHLLGTAFEYTAGSRALAEAYCADRPLPPGVGDRDGLERLLRKAGRPYAPFTDREIIDLFNTLLFMRKELAL